MIIKIKRKIYDKNLPYDRKRSKSLKPHLLEKRENEK